ncbi:RGN.2 family protein [Megaselia abdita]
MSPLVIRFILVFFSLSSLSAYRIDELLDIERNKVGEGPHWDVRTQSLYMVNKCPPKLIRYDYKTNKFHQCRFNFKVETAAFVIPIEDEPKKFAVGLDRKVAVVQWDGRSRTCRVKGYLFEVEGGLNRNFNSGKCDPQGRLFAGTECKVNSIGGIFRRPGSYLYKYDECGLLEVIETVRIANGLAWDVNLAKMYHVDSAEFNIKVYNYDFKSGKVCDPEIAFDFVQYGKPLPYGMTIDTDGNLYVATFNGSRVYIIDPSFSSIKGTIDLPTKQITSCAFGGPNLDILYVTTGNRYENPPTGGKTYQVTGLGSRGYPMTNFKATPDNSELKAFS